MTIEHIKQISSTAKLVFSHLEINDALDSVAARLNHDYQDKEPLFLCVVLGGIAVFGQLMTKIDVNLEIDYIHATRYDGETVGSDIKWKAKPRVSLLDRDIVIVDDILDGGLTLKAICDFCLQEQAKSIATVVLLDKTKGRDLGGVKHADYTALSTNNNDYLFGFGMDYNNYLRNANGIFAADKKLISANIESKKKSFAS